MNTRQLENDLKDCPVCAETIKKAALKCRFCGSDLQAFMQAQEAERETLLFNGHPATIYSTWQWFPIALTFGLAYFYYKIKSLSLKYEITSQRIKIERGLISKTKDNVELFTIEHYDMDTPIGMKLEGYCILQLRSTDSSCKSLLLYGIKDLDVLADNLRSCSLRERLKRRVVPVMQS